MDILGFYEEVAHVLFQQSFSVDVKKMRYAIFLRPVHIPLTHKATSVRRSFAAFKHCFLQIKTVLLGRRP